jgi:hypothetical protein
VETASGDLSFESDVWPIFQDNCSPCHVSGNLGGHNVASDDLADAFEGAVDVEEAILSEIEGGGMPPSCGGAPGSSASCVSEDDFASIQSWYDSGAPE